MLSKFIKTFEPNEDYLLCKFYIKVFLERRHLERSENLRQVYDCFLLV